MATVKLARWATRLNSTAISASVDRAASRSLYNWIGCAIGGSQHDTVKKAHLALTPLFGAPTATLFGNNGTSRTDMQHACLLNGIASHVHDYDDTHLATIIHPTGPVASAILAYAEYVPVSGRALMDALIAGIEASCKLGLSVWPEHYDIGWHITSTTGSIGAAVAVGKLMGLDEEAMANAIGLASVQVVGLREMFGSDTKSFHPGRAAQNGLLAALCAQQGFTSSTQALEAKRGWANVVAGGGKPKLDHYLEELGQVWEIESNAFKPFPCGIVCHPAIDASIQIAQQLRSNDQSVDAIESVMLKVHPLVIELTSKRTPQDGLQGKFSVFHGCAVGLLYGKAGPAQYTDEIVINKSVVSLRDRIDAQSDSTLRADETIVEVTFKDGNKLTKHIEHAVGSLEAPMTNEQLQEKFMDQCVPILGEDGAYAASERCWQLGETQNVSDILKLL